MSVELVNNALTMAIWRLKNVSNVIVHSDRGSQYAAQKYQQLLTKHGLKGSMSRKGNCWDNAVSESFFHTLKESIPIHK